MKIESDKPKESKPESLSDLLSIVRKFNVHSKDKRASISEIVRDYVELETRSTPYNAVIKVYQRYLDGKYLKAR